VHRQTNTPNFRGTSAQILAWPGWFETATAVWAVQVAALLQFADRSGSPLRVRGCFRLTLVIGVILVSVGGYLGASLIYGLQHFAW